MAAIPHWVYACCPEEAFGRPGDVTPRQEVAGGECEERARRLCLASCKNFHMAWNGQVEDPVAPTNTVPDLPKRSLLERFRWMEREFVVAEMSLRRRCLVFVNLLCVGQEYSLALRKP